MTHNYNRPASSSQRVSGHHFPSIDDIKARQQTSLLSICSQYGSTVEPVNSSQRHEVSASGLGAQARHTRSTSMQANMFLSSKMSGGGQIERESNTAMK